MAQRGLPDWMLQAAKKVNLQFEDTKGKCLVIANQLVEELESKGVTCAVQFGTFNGERHAWVDVWTQDGVWLLDASADQFGDYPSVIVGKMAELEMYGWAN
jgi:hypothetical protein